MTNSTSRNTGVSRRGFLSLCVTTASVVAAGRALADTLPTEPNPNEPSPTPHETPGGILRGVVSTTPAQAGQNAVVYIENAPVDRITDGKLDDIKLNFVPHVCVMTAGGTLTYVNHHPFPDSAFSASNEKWDFGVVEANGSRKRKFEKAGIYTLLCHIHPNQVGFLVVSPSSYFAKADKQGHFELPNVPPGAYDVVAWAPRMKPERKSVVVTAGAEAVVDFELKR